MKVRGPVERDGQVAIDVEGARHSDTIRIDLLSTEGTTLATSSADAALTAALLLAMRAGEDLIVDGTVSHRLQSGTDEVQRLIWTWDRTLRLREPKYRRIAVDIISDDEDHRGAPGRGTAAFFTGGVDSFYTAVVHQEELDALVYVHGFDVALDDVVLRAEVSDRLRQASAALDLPLIEVAAAFPVLGESFEVGWLDFHGAALATIAHLLSDRFDRILIPSTHTYAHLESLGSHPLLDPCWSSNRLSIVHDGAEANRVDKLRRIVEVPAARAHLRVCWENREGAYNCGRCEKCIRTGAAARIAGVEGRFAGIASPTLSTIARVRATGVGSAWSELRDELERLDTNPRLRRTIDLVLVRSQLARWRPTSRWFR